MKLIGSALLTFSILSLSSTASENTLQTEQNNYYLGGVVKHALANSRACIHPNGGNIKFKTQSGTNVVVHGDACNSNEARISWFYTYEKQIRWMGDNESDSYRAERTGLCWEPKFHSNSYGGVNNNTEVVLRPCDPNNPWQKWSLQRHGYWSAAQIKNDMAYSCVHINKGGFNPRNNDSLVMFNECDNEPRYMWHIR
ncbi:hypothetical protein N473_09070 [Pseudoalteromonas luteoviolacea CPMOR-1]|uniref:Uncharacterized protein n=1 Tax=Pseudoalteromonas luteoviolacea CPMOR-1 TaxID=1365248 RepID=A0A167MK07_9GAMM|nr:hypothetical protein [Pseudoalteromonas luteoviolacea]KZN66533.1 hypothetical protein N473_09070 [Pseudoalteromonas luteoviolacea CPMOR-1]